MNEKIYERLNELYSQKDKIEAEIKELEDKLEESKSRFKRELTKEEKIDLFKNTFINTQSIFAKKWISKDGLKQSFYPVSQSFKGNNFLPITNKDLELHLRGQVQLASYLIDDENRVRFVVLELLQSDIPKILNSFTL
nr:hypothetical protein [Halarcobacter ebronensis]